MYTTQLIVAGAGLFFLFIFLSGIWLSRSGKPYSGIVLTIHKLISLAALVFLGISMYQMNQAAGLSTPELAAGVVSGLFFVDAIVSGGLLSMDKPMPAAISVMHRIAPVLSVLSTAATLYLVLSRR